MSRRIKVGDFHVFDKNNETTQIFDLVLESSADQVTVYRLDNYEPEGSKLWTYPYPGDLSLYLSGWTSVK